jgi:cadmium resistance protein CadD (predicted permease)
MPHRLVTVFAASIVTFVAANTDDLLTLVVFMAQIDRLSAQYYHVFIGQFIGFTVLTAFSLLGLVFGKFVPGDYLGLMGFLPLLNGCWKMFKQIRNQCRNRSAQLAPCVLESEIEKEIKEVAMLVEYEVDQSNNPAKEYLLPSETPSSTPDRQEAEEEDEDEFEETVIVGVSTESTEKSSWGKTALFQIVRALKLVFHAKAIEVALVVIGDGGDSLTSALPLFANETPSEILLTLAIFYTATFILCTVAWSLVKCSLVARFMQKYGNWVRPVMLMCLGVYILSDSILATLITGVDDDDD